jgi:acyl-coenzyme A thioesterase PaaI-like protein
MSPIPPRTHLAIDPRLVGTPLEIADGSAHVVLVTLPEMAADERGLVHGGFVFGLADYAAMLAVNQPNVVLGSSEIRFLKPVMVGERLVAEAVVEKTEGTAGKKIKVRAVVRRGEEEVLTGSFLCFTPERHVLEGV